MLRRQFYLIFSFAIFLVGQTAFLAEASDFPREKVIQALKINVEVREKAQRDLREKYLELSSKLEDLKPEATGNYSRMMARANDILDRQVIAAEEREIFQSLLSAAQEELAYRSCREFLQKRLTHIIERTFPTVDPVRPQERRRLQRLLGAKAALVTASGNGLSTIHWFAGYLRKTSRDSLVQDLEVLAGESNFDNGVDSEKARSATLEDAGDYVDEVLGKSKSKD